MSFHLQVIGVEDNFRARVVQVVVLRRDFVYRNFVEHGYNSHVASNDRIGCNFGFSVLQHPFVENLARDERILGHDADSFACSPEVLGELIKDGYAIIAEHNKANLVCIFKLCREREIGGNFFTAGVFGIANKPANELLSFHRRVIRGKFQRVARVVGVSLINGTIVELKCHRESVLRVLSPNLEVTRCRHAVVVITIGINPLTGIAILSRNSWNVVHTVVGFKANNPGSVYICSIYSFIEGDSVSDWVVIWNDSGIRRRYISAINTGTGDANLRSLTTFDNFTNGPIGGVIASTDNTWNSIAYSLAFCYVYNRIHFGISVIESNLPCISSIFCGP